MKTRYFIYCLCFTFLVLAVVGYNSLIFHDKRALYELYVRFCNCAITNALRIGYAKSVWEDPRVWSVSRLNNSLIGTQKINEWNDEVVDENENTDAYSRLVIGLCQRENCYNNIKRIKRAMEAYYEEHGEAVPLFSVDENGNPLHSWRVLLLPYLGYRGLYERIRLNEEWNSEWNSQFALTPECYCCPAQRKFGKDLIAGKTCYSAIIQAPSESSASQYCPLKAKDGRRIIIMERSPQHSWMDPTPEHELMENIVVTADYYSDDSFFNHADRSIGILGDAPFVVASDNDPERPFWESPRVFREKLLDGVSLP